MPYKFNNGNSAFTCPKCNTIMCTGEDAIACREAERDYKETLMCRDCFDKAGKEDEVAN